MPLGKARRCSQERRAMTYFCSQFHNPRHYPPLHERSCWAISDNLEYTAAKDGTSFGQSQHARLQSQNKYGSNRTSPSLRGASEGRAPVSIGGSTCLMFFLPKTDATFK